MPNAVEIHWAWLIPALPALGAFANATIGKKLQDRLGKGAVHGIAVGAMVLSTAVAWAYFAVMLGTPAEDRYLHQTLWPAFAAGSLRVDLAFALDPLSMMMTLVVTNIATLIHVYSIGYMAEEPSYWRFFSYMNLFVFSMLLLVMGSNFVILFFGWEGVGLCSYLLISFWYTDLDKARAGMKAFVVNRFGDFAFIIGLFALMWGLGGSWTGQKSGGLSLRDGYAASAVYAPLHDGATAAEAEAMTPREHGIAVGPTLDFRELRAEILAPETGILTHLKTTTIFGLPLVAFVCILLFGGATGKSAQIPLYVWLPDAMAGPTPVSALIHAATMVTAGVYLMARISPILHLSASAGTVIAIFGVATAFVAAAAATSQNDIKKVLAYSTVSQLGYMFLGIGSGAYVAAIFLMITHAFYKGLLFLGAGSVIHSMHDEQDIKKMGALYKLMPITGFTFIIAWLSIAGLPPFSGFFSKGDVLLGAYSKSPWLWALGALTAVLTAYYMGREVYLVFFGDARYAKALAGSDHHAQPHESPAIMTVPLVVLAVASVVAGVLNLGFTSSTDFLANWLSPVFGSAETALGFGTGTRAILETGDAVFAIVGILLAWRAWASRSENASLEPRFLVKAWGIDLFLDKVFSGGSQVLARSMNSVVDNALIDGAVKGTGTLVAGTAGQVRKLQSGYVRSYALVISFGVVLILGFVLTRASF